MTKTKFLNKKKTTWTFSAISLISGTFFLNHSITGNAILNEAQPMQFLPLIGLLLIGCSLILALYSIRKK